MRASACGAGADKPVKRRLNAAEYPRVGRKAYGAVRGAAIEWADISIAMPEALAVVAVFVVTVVAWVGAWLHARNPANQNVHDEIARLRQHVGWIEQRIELAERERWGTDMVATLMDEKAAAAEHLARACLKVERARG